MIRTRNDLIAYLENNAPQGCIRRAVSEGRVENLGAFTSSPQVGSPQAWIVRVVSRHNKSWHLLIRNHYLVDKPKPTIIGGHIFKNWVGNGGVTDKPSLMNGDKPLLYRELRNKEIEDDNAHSNM